VLGGWMCAKLPYENRGIYMSLPLHSGRLRDPDCLSPFQVATDGCVSSKLSQKPSKRATRPYLVASWWSGFIDYPWLLGRADMGSLVRKSGSASCWCLTHGPHRVFGASRFRLSHSVYFTPVEKGWYNVAKATVETSLCPRRGVGWDEACVITICCSDPDQYLLRPWTSKITISGLFVVFLRGTLKPYPRFSGRRGDVHYP